ncbi:MAG: hypothetical protein ABEJ05_02395 [Haloglomus sp.]
MFYEHPTDDEGAPAATRVDASSGARDLWAKLGERVHYRDLLLLAAVPLVLGGVYVLPSELKWQLALDYRQPTLLSAFASHFVHFSGRHLLVNLLGYLLVVPTGYVLSVASQHRQRFLVAFASFLLSFPFVLSGLNLLFPRAAVGVGFSGIVLAFVGYLPVALLRFLETHLHDGIRASASNWLFFFGLGFVAYMAAPGIYGPGLAAAAFLAGILFLLPLVESLDRGHLAALRATMSVSGYAELALFGVLTFGAYLFVAFPATTAVAGGVLNTYTHALGFCLGYITTHVTALGGWLGTG